MEFELLGTIYKSQDVRLKGRRLSEHLDKVVC